MRSFTLGLFIADFWHVDSLVASEHWATGGAYVMVICDITNSRIGAGLIDREAILIFFHSKNFEIHDVKQSKNINGYVLNSFLCFNSGCSVSSRRFVINVICVFAYLFQIGFSMGVMFQLELSL